MDDSPWPGNPQVILDVDRLIHEPARMVIVAILAAVESADFVYLQRATGLTVGNLSSHLAKLADAGYLSMAKSFRGKLPLTTCRLTASGREAWATYRAQIGRALALER